MNEITKSNIQLPNTVEELAKFALIGREKLNVVRSAIRAIDKVGLAKEVREQKLKEGQEIADAVLDAEVRIGELLNEMPKETNNNPHGNNQYTGQIESGVDSSTTKNFIVEHEEKEPESQFIEVETETVEVQPKRIFTKPKMEAVKELGITQKQAEHFQQMAKHPEAVEIAKARARKDNDIVSREKVLKTIKQEEADIKAVRKAEAKMYEKPKELPKTCRLINADIREGLPMIEDESVDFIITDPPYPKEYIPLYENLSKVANRVLKQGGSLLVLCGQKYLNQTMKLLNAHMEYHWILSYLTEGGQSPVTVTVHDKVNTFWKPILWFTKGEYKGDVVGDVIKAGKNENDKEFHKWGQNEIGFEELIRKFTYPKQVILDPFVGGGTTGVCAVKMNREFIGVDINADCITTTKKRIEDALDA